MTNEHGIVEPDKPGFYWVLDRHGAWEIARRFRDLLEAPPDTERYHWSTTSDADPTSWRELGARWVIGPITEPAGLPGEYFE